MNIQKFVASTSREALGKARMAFGDTAVILSNKSTPEGVEVIATAEDSLTSLQPPAPKSAAARQRTRAPVPGANGCCASAPTRPTAARPCPSPGRRRHRHRWWTARSGCARRRTAPKCRFMRPPRVARTRKRSSRNCRP